MKRITTIKRVTMAILVHGRATVNDTMLLYRAVPSIRSFSSISRVRARIDKTHRPSKIPNHVVTMANVQSRERQRAFIIFFTVFSHANIGAYIQKYTRDVAPPPHGRIEFIFGSARYRWFIAGPSFPHFPAFRRNDISTCIALRERGKKITSYCRAKAHVCNDRCFPMCHEQYVARYRTQIP